jgi:predicted nucleic acid-binding protein
MIYWDTSAILKLYAPEMDSAYFLRLATRAEEQVVTSSIASIELLCAFERKERNGELKRGGAKAAFEQFLSDTRRGRIIEIPYGHDVVEEARKLLGLVRDQAILIRSLDMIHVASAIAAKAKTIAATDSRLRQLASCASLKVLPD